MIAMRFMLEVYNLHSRITINLVSRCNSQLRRRLDSVRGCRGREVRAYPVLSKINSRIISTNAGCVPAVAALTIFNPISFDTF
mgnify:CR=1 FL=1